MNLQFKEKYFQIRVVKTINDETEPVPNNRSTELGGTHEYEFGTGVSEPVQRESEPPIKVLVNQFLKNSLCMKQIGAINP